MGSRHTHIFCRLSQSFHRQARARLPLCSHHTFGTFTTFDRFCRLVSLLKVSAMSDSMTQVVETLDPVSRRLIPPNIDLGTLVPLKTTLELRENLSLGLAYITRAPTRLTNDVVTISRALVGDDAAKNLPHLRRCCKPADLPPHLKAAFMNEGNGRAIHTGKSNWLYILLGPKDEISYDELLRGLATVDGIRDDIFVGIIPVPLLAPTSQVQANMWSQQFWQTVYRKNNPLGPHPSSICRTTSVVSRDAAVWMTLAHQIAKKAHKAGFGEPIGAVIIKRTVPGKPETAKATAAREDSKVDGTQANLNNPELANGGRPQGDIPSANGGGLDQSATKNNAAEANQVAETMSTGTGSQKSRSGSQDLGPSALVNEDKETTQIVAIAADARWHQQDKTGRTGNPMAHAALRAISMVAQKLVRAENRPSARPDIMEFEAFQDKPLLHDEQIVFEAEHPCPDGYLCHELELYMTHEPCTMCAMAILHSRMGRIVFRHRMPLTGGMSSEDRSHDVCGTSSLCGDGSCGGGRGLGLHWRKELNWSMLGWEWETDDVERLTVDPHIHA
ncbi:cytidine deaminase-like protein [Biscogniauxia mediterranea]|nr:cytidine deaminase-like protein [Biscogniauxia mediterranea]